MACQLRPGSHAGQPCKTATSTPQHSTPLTCSGVRLASSTRAGKRRRASSMAVTPGKSSKLGFFVGTAFDPSFPHAHGAAAAAWRGRGLPCAESVVHAALTALDLTPWGCYAPKATGAGAAGFGFNAPASRWWWWWGCSACCAGCLGTAGGNGFGREADSGEGGDFSKKSHFGFSFLQVCPRHRAGGVVVFIRRLDLRLDLRKRFQVFRDSELLANPLLLEMPQAFRTGCPGKNKWHGLAPR